MHSLATANSSPVKSTNKYGLDESRMHYIIGVVFCNDFVDISIVKTFLYFQVVFVDYKISYSYNYSLDYQKGA